MDERRTVALTCCGQVPRPIAIDGKRRLGLALGTVHSRVRRSVDHHQRLAARGGRDGCIHSSRVRDVEAGPVERPHVQLPLAGQSRDGVTDLAVGAGDEKAHEYR